MSPPQVCCELCEEPFSAIGGITTTLGYICYPCIEWLLAAAWQCRALQERNREEMLSDIDATP